MMSKVSAKDSLRILKFLEATSMAAATPFCDGKADRVLLRSKENKKVLTSSAVLDALHRAALIEIAGDTYKINKTGRLRLKRLDQGDLGFLAQHRKTVSQQVKVDGQDQSVVVNQNESPLIRLRHRKTADGKPWLDEDHVEAGERLRRDFTMGQLMQKVTSSWDAAIGSSRAGRGGKVDLSDNAIDARARIEKAMHAVGPDLATVLTDVCCFLKGLESVEREHRWPPRSAKLMLRTGLGLLAQHYGTKAVGAARTKNRHWGGKDYRPVISV